MSSTTTTTSLYGDATFCVITGASQGIGQTLAIHLAKKLGPKSVMVLTARNALGLEETKFEVNKVVPSLEVRCISGDLSDKVQLPQVCDECFAFVDPSVYKHALLVQNAGTLGDLVYLRDLHHKVDQIQSNMLVNVTAAIALTAKFLVTFKKSDTLQRSVINITSIAGIKPFKSWGLYCTMKAAREMMFKVLAEEEPDMRVLNWSPGPVATQMNVTVTEHTADEETKKMMKDTQEKKMVLTTDQTCEMLIKVLDENTFKSGDHVDYFDVKK